MRSLLEPVATGVAFTNADGKEIELLSGNSSLLAGSLFPIGTIIKSKVHGKVATYVVTKAGFANASALSDTRQALWKMIAPYTALTYKVITGTNYDVQFEDEFLEVDASAGDVNINLIDDLNYVIPGCGGARLLTVKKKIRRQM